MSKKFEVGSWEPKTLQPRTSNVELSDSSDNRVSYP